MAFAAGVVGETITGKDILEGSFRVHIYYLSLIRVNVVLHGCSVEMDRVKKIIETRRVVSPSDLIHLCRHFVLITLLSLVIFSLPVSGGNVIVRNGQLNVSAGIYSDSDTFYIDSENDRVGIGTTSPAGRLDVNGSLGCFYIDSGGSSAIFTRNSWNYIATSGAASNLAVKTGGSDWGDVRVVILSDGKVGVGTTTPSAKLEVNGSLRVDNSTGSAVFYVNSSNGNVGIGTATPETKLDIAGTEAEYKTIQFTDTTSNEKWQWSHRIGGQNNRFDMYYYNGSSWSTAYMSVSTEGNIGIGTTTPVKKMQIIDTSAGSNTTPLLLTNAGGSSAGTGVSLGFAPFNTSLVMASITSYRLGSNDYPLTFNVWDGSSAVAERMRIDKNGYVGIGTTAPTTKLQVDGDIYINETGSNPADLTINSLASNDQVIYFKEAGTANWVIRGDNYLAPNSNVFSISDQSSEVLTILQGGYVGIGTTSPASDLHIYGAGTNDPNLLLGNWSDTSTGVGLRLIPDMDGGVNYLDIHTTPGSGSHRFVIRVNNDTTGLTNALSIDTANGRVGIGTTGPSEELVVGDNLGSLTGSTAVVVGDSDGEPKLFLGQDSSNMGWILWDSSKYMRLETKEDGSTYSNTVVLNAGKVGIGTADPGDNLEVYESGDAPYIGLNRDGNKIWGISINSAGNLAFQSGGTWTALRASTPKLWIGNSTGYVGIGTASPNDALDVIGDIDATGCVQTDDSGSIGGTCVSDVRFKTNIQSLEGSLDRISQLNPVSFEWDPEYYAISSENGTGVGLIAQELEEVYPELVVTGEDGYKRVRYDIELEMHLIQAVKELKVENEELKAEKDAEILALKQAVCELNPDAVFCNDL